jgi:PUA-domain protein
MPATIKNRHRLKNRDVRDLFADLQSRFAGKIFDEQTCFETGLLGDFQVFLVGNDIDLFMFENKVFFTLRGITKYQPSEGRVVVDMGAVGFIVKGADIMAPGIVDADINIKEGDFVWVCDEKHHKPLAVGIALMNGETMKASKTGKAIRNVHYVGDVLWNLLASG